MIPVKLEKLPSDNSGWLQSSVDFDQISIDQRLSLARSERLSQLKEKYGSLPAPTIHSPGISELSCRKIDGPGRGRPKKDDSYVYVTIGLRPAHWEWLKLWFPNGSPSDCVRALLDRAVKFWPAGPGRFR